jgi:hypothetical protein
MKWLLAFFPVLLSCIPEWVVLGSLVPVTVACIHFRKRRAIRNACVALGLLLAISIPGLRIFDAYARALDLRRHFGTVPDADNIVESAFRHLAIEESGRYWKLKDLDAGDCNQIIQEFGLIESEDERLLSLTDAPPWWPDSTEGYSIFKGSDSDLGSREVWMAKNGTGVYLYKFTE